MMYKESAFKVVFIKALLCFLYKNERATIKIYVGFDFMSPCDMLSDCSDQLPYYFLNEDNR